MTEPRVRPRISRRPGSADGGAIMARAYIPDREIGPISTEVRMAALKTVARQAVTQGFSKEEAVDIAFMLGLIGNDDD